MAMPKIDYHCEQCGHDFERVGLQGEPKTGMKCPKCKGAHVKAVKGSDRLFNGISNFSSLAKDTN